jgi:uncharacterized protein (TIGR03000 family)
MYGVVLLMALSGGGDQPVWLDSAGEHIARYGDHGQKEYRCGGRRGRRGCHGGGGCSGGGCCGYGGGCYGGGGGCYGGGGWGCTGGGRGYGGCSGGYGYGSMPYAGGYYGASPYAGMGYYGSATFGTPIYAGGMPLDYRYGTPIDQGYYAAGGGAERLGAPSASGDAPATLVVHLPADAKLMIEGSPTISTQNVRTFISPSLQPGKDYQYTLRAEVMRDGKKVERTKDVNVRAGQQSEVTIDLPPESGPPKE